MRKNYFLPQRSWEAEAEESRKKGKKFEEEEVVSSMLYPAGRKIKTIQQQLLLLAGYFPSLKAKLSSVGKPPSAAEGWIVIPNYSVIALDYNQALETALDLLQKERPRLLNWRKGELGKNYLRLTRRTEKALHKLNKMNRGDYLVIPAQLGLRHLGRSARRTHILLETNEFGLGPFETTIFLLTHPEWLSTPDDLGIDCIGCEYTLYKHGYFKYILFFYFFGNSLRFGDRWCGCPDKKFGPVTGFLYQTIDL